VTRLSDPRQSRVVLVGSSTYAQLQPLPTVATNLTGVSDVLTDPDLWGLPSANCHVVSDPSTPQEVGRALRVAARSTGVSGLLLVYFAGHGVVDARTGELHLAVAQTDREAVYATAVPYEWVRRSVLESPASRRVVILDCCYAGRAISGMSDEITTVADEVEIDRTCVLVATSPNRAAVAPPDEKHTAFTGALIEVLRRGVPDGPDPLDMAAIYDEVYKVQRRRGRPLPEMRARNGGERVPLVHNAARPVRTGTPTQPPPVPEPTSRAGTVLVAGPDVTDPELAGAAVAILAHTPFAGALGVRLDRPTSRSALDVLDDERSGPIADATVFDGGPVRDVVILLAAPRPGATPGGFRPVRDGLGTLPPAIDPGPYTLAAACLFVGYLGWRPGQLEAELASGELTPSAVGLGTWFWQHFEPR
jgi:putative transcriptional regulator